MRLVLCVPVPMKGQHFLNLLVSTAKATCSGRHEIVVRFTSHDKAQRDAIIGNGLDLPIESGFVVPRECRSYPHANSVTHSRCIGELFKDIEGDIAVFCDFDAGFVMAGWDECLVALLTSGGFDLVGAPYSETNTVCLELPDGRVRARKYQHKPNLIFLAFDAQKMRARTNTICSFADQYAEPHLPAVRRICTELDSQVFGLPVGSYLNLDTGFRIPELIATHNLAFHLLERRVSGYAVVRLPFLCRVGQADVLKPEEYWLDGRPLFIHFKKGSRIGARGFRPWDYSVDDFARDIWRYLSRTGQVSISKNTASGRDFGKS